MNVALFVWWILVGWCGTVPRPPIPIPIPNPPDPDPWYQVLGVVGGVVGGFAFSQVFPAGDASMAVVAATSGLGALAGSVLFGGIYGMVRGTQRAASRARS